ncbi:hypothetical protein Pfo_024503 [Paulownia fortunei]|nr:hypothetical protein Pfo_024503 [Paulownia fortunei]
MAQTDQTSHNEDYAINDDPIFSNHVKLYIVPYLKRNMLMIENQLPKLVLEKLVSFQNDNSLKNALGGDKAVANLFNSLSKDITLDLETSLDEVHKQVSAYCQKPWHQWRANLMHTNLTNPWAILSVIAAIFLFALTIIQAVYSVLSYVSLSS